MPRWSVVQPEHFFARRMSVAASAVVLDRLGLPSGLSCSSDYPGRQRTRARNPASYQSSVAMTPRDFTLVAFGGAGPLHLIWRHLFGLSRVGSSWLWRPPDRHGCRTRYANVSAQSCACWQRWRSRETIECLVAELEHMGVADLAEEGYEPALMKTDLTLTGDEGQSYEINVPYPQAEGLTAFHELHKQRYGHSDQ